MSQLDFPEAFHSAKEAAQYSGYTDQAICLAIRQGKLKAKRICDKRWYILRKDIDYYSKFKHTRKLLMRDGKPLYDYENGPYAPEYVADFLSQALDMHFPRQRVYYLMRIGQIKGFKTGGVWAIYKEHILEFIEQNRKKEALLDVVS
jgi:hypothetical protein